MAEEKVEMTSGDAGKGSLQQQQPNAGEQQPAGERPISETGAEVVTISKTDFEKMQKALREANTEAARRRKELEDRQKAEMTEAERLKKDLDEERALRLGLMRESVAAKYGLPELLASRLQGGTREEMEEDARAVAAALPKPAAKSPGPVTPGNPGSKINLTREQVERMSVEEINKNWDAVQEALSRKVS